MLGKVWTQQETPGAEGVIGSLKERLKWAQVQLKLRREQRHFPLDKSSPERQRPTLPLEQLTFPPSHL